HRRVVSDRKSEIPARSRPQPSSVSHNQRLVETVAGTQCRDRVWGNLRIQTHLIEKRSGSHLGEDETKHGDSKEYGHGSQQSSQDVSHAMIPTEARFS